MKKYIVLIIFSIFIVSCNHTEKTWENKEKLNNSSLQKNINIENKISEDEKELNKNIEKLKNFKYKSKEFYQCINPTITSCIDNEYYTLANENIDVKYCEKLWNKISILECRKNIFLLESLKTKDVSKCDTLFWTWEIIDCKNNIYSILAKSENNIIYCNKIIENDDDKFDKERKQRCKNEVYLQRAKTEKNKKYCENIKSEFDPMIRQICEDEIEMEIQMEKDMKKINEK